MARVEHRAITEALQREAFSICSVTCAASRFSMSDAATAPSRSSCTNEARWSPGSTDQAR